MAVKEDLTWHKFGEWTVIEELGGGKVTCQCSCGTVKVLYKKAVKEGKTKSCGCLKSRVPLVREDLTSKVFGQWEVLKELGGGKVLCRCSCGTEREVYKQALKEGRSTSCGCSYIGKPKTEVEIGTTFGALTVTKQLMGGKVICRCSCGSEKEYYLHNLLNGTTKTCGHNKLQNTEGQQFGYWTVVKELGYGKVLCKCECGTERELYKKTLKEGRSKSCGCKSLENLQKQLEEKYLGKTFGYWKVIGVTTDHNLTCRCICGAEKVLNRQTIVEGKSKSCGCRQKELELKAIMEKYGDNAVSRANNPRENWQMDTISSKEKLSMYLDTFKEKPTISELSTLLDITEYHVGRKIQDYDLRDKINYRPHASKYEKLLCDMVRKLCGENTKIIINDRDTLCNSELDIYIPDLKLAIEINGDYWHSDIYKDKYYHLNKTLACNKLGIRLIHVFEYELKDEFKQEKILNLIKNTIHKDKKIYARNTVIKHVSDSECMEFLNKYHLQGYTTSSVMLGLYFNDELVQLITFGKPRFNTNYQYEVIRSCTRDNTAVVGGLSKLMKGFIKLYNPESIISYVDRSKFSGESYIKAGFDAVGYTEPSYVWVKNKKVFSRYQTQKSKLIENGLGSEDQTEDQIMKTHGFMKIYNCGNIKMLYKREENKDGDR